MSWNPGASISSRVKPVIAHSSSLIRSQAPSRPTTAMPTAACSKMARNSCSLFSSAAATRLRSVMSSPTPMKNAGWPSASHTRETLVLSQTTLPSLRRRRFSQV